MSEYMIKLNGKIFHRRIKFALPISMSDDKQVADEHTCRHCGAYIGIARNSHERYCELRPKEEQSKQEDDLIDYGSGLFPFGF